MKKKKTIMQIGDMTVTPTKDGKIELKLGKNKTIVEYKELWGAIFVLSDKERQDAMMPVRKEERMVFSRQIQIKLKNDMKAGEVVKAWTEISIPQTIVEAIAEENGAKVIIKALDEVVTANDSK